MRGAAPVWQQVQELIRERLYQQAYNGIPAWLPYRVACRVTHMTCYRRKSLADGQAVDILPAPLSLEESDAVRVDATLAVSTHNHYQRIIGVHQIAHDTADVAVKEDVMMRRI